ncbi:MAG TPA: YeeE/YedE family protein [Burkholderiaceae bacterium]|nr:YeeE/YedE family protein [Burkholderiaceae bacterium]
MPEVDIASLSTQVVVAAFVLGALFGAIVHRTNFCTMGSVADIVGFGDWTRMRMWALAIAVAVAGTTLLAAFGLIDPADSFYTSRRFTPLAYVLGGSLFGFGMVLAGGCGSKSLVRAGAGSLKALVVVCVMGLVAYITLRGVLAIVRVRAIESIGFELATTQDLPSVLAGTSASLGLVRLVIAGIVAVALLVFVLRDRAALTKEVVLGGIGVGAVIVAVWYVSGHVGHLAEHPATLEEAYLRTNSGRMEALSFVAPVAWTLDYLMFFSDASKVITVGIASVAGVIAGAAASALLTGRFRWEGFRDTEDTANHLAGAGLMGFGGVTAMGCTIGQGLSGVSMLAVGSVITLAAIVIGAVAALRYQAWRIERMA